MFLDGEFPLLVRDHEKDGKMIGNMRVANTVRKVVNIDAEMVSSGKPSAEHPVSVTGAPETSPHRLPNNSAALCSALGSGPGWCPAADEAATPKPLDGESAVEHHGEFMYDCRETTDDEEAMGNLEFSDDEEEDVKAAERCGYGYLFDGSSSATWPKPSRWPRKANDAWKVPSIPSQLQPRHDVDENGIFVSVDWSEESNINAADIEREIAVTLDSGAVDHVISTELLPAQTEICEVTGSRVGKRLVAANGQPMQTFGECILECEDDTGKSAGSFAVTEVSRALQSVSRICDQDLEVLFTKSEARIRDPKTGKYVARYARKGGLYTRMVRVRPGSKPDSSARPKPAATGGGRRPGPFTRPSKKP